MMAAVTVLVLAAPALAQGSAAPVREPVGFRMMFLLLFLMLGPIKIIAPFASITREFDARRRRRIADAAILFSAVALAIAGLLGRSMLDNFAIPTPVLALTGGLILFLVALRTVLEQFSGATRPAIPPQATDTQIAISPIAFPTIVTPFGIAATIVFVTLAGDDLGAKLIVAGAVLLILLLDWVVMLFAHRLLGWLGVVLQVLGAVLGVTQVAIGLHVILRNLSEIGVIALRVP